MFKKDSLKMIEQWDLYRSYGQFNLYFEAVIASFRELLIEIIKEFYDTVPFEDPNTEEPYPDDKEDKMLRLILHDDGAMAIVEKCRSCLKELISQETIKMHEENDIEPFFISEFDAAFSELLIKKTIELIKLRNVIIHSHYEMVMFDYLKEVTILKGKKDSKTSKGYRQDYYEFSNSDFEMYNESMEHIFYFSRLLFHHLGQTGMENCYTNDQLLILKGIEFLPKAN